jgi:hypothetical protein
MAGKTPGTRKGASPKKATKQKSAVTPIDQGNPAVSQGNASGNEGNSSANHLSADRSSASPSSASRLSANAGNSPASPVSSTANEGSHGISVVNSGNKAENSGFGSTEQGIVELIRIRAYELFEERGRLEGYDQEDWARAEAEILAKFEREKSA